MTDRQGGWRDMTIGARMTVDGEFSSRVDGSRFTRQEWGLIMTAVTFDIEDPDDDAAAKIVADTADLREIMPEIEKVAEMDPMGNPRGTSESGGGLLGSLLGALGLGDGGGGDEVDEAKLEAAETLASEYAEELQAHLESTGRWDEIRAAAAKER